MRCLHRALNLWYQSYLCFRLQPDIKAINTNRNLSKYKSIMSRLQLILSYFQRAHLLSSNVGVAQKDHCWKPWQNSFSAVSYGRRACSYRVSGGSICLPVFFDLTTVAILVSVCACILHPWDQMPKVSENGIFSDPVCCAVCWNTSSVAVLCVFVWEANMLITVILYLWTSGPFTLSLSLVLKCACVCLQYCTEEWI